MELFFFLFFKFCWSLSWHPYLLCVVTQGNGQQGCLNFLRKLPTLESGYGAWITPVFPFPLSLSLCSSVWLSKCIPMCVCVCSSWRAPPSRWIRSTLTCAPCWWCWATTAASPSTWSTGSPPSRASSPTPSTTSSVIRWWWVRLCSLVPGPRQSSRNLLSLTRL